MGLPEAKIRIKDEVKDDDDRSSQSNRSSESNSSKLYKLKKKMKKSFTTMKTQIEELEDQSYISDSEESGSMFLQLVDMRSTVLKEQHNTFLNNEKKTKSGALTKPLNLREVFLLDNQSNADLA